MEYVKPDTIKSVNFDLFKQLISDPKSYLLKHQIIWNNMVEVKLIKQFRDFCSMLLIHVRERFPHKEHISSMHVFELDSLLRINPEDDEKLIGDGRKEILNLGEHFGRIKTYKTSSYKRDYLPGIISRDDLMLEFSHFKYMVYFNFSGDTNFDTMSNQEKWDKLFRLYSDRFPNLFALAKIVFIIPASTVACERLFSQKTLIKNKTRNGLKTRTVDMLLRVGLYEGQEFTGYHRQIIDNFLTSKTRFEISTRARLNLFQVKNFDLILLK
jgi:hypothetical protein